MGAHIERGVRKVDKVKLSGNGLPICGGRFAAIVLCVVDAPKIGLGGSSREEGLTCGGVRNRVASATLEAP
eukprot:3523568-Rhodomonas_salina.1